MKGDKKDLEESEIDLEERETDEEQQVRLVNAKLSLHKANDFCPLHDID